MKISSALRQLVSRPSSHALANASTVNVTAHLGHFETEWLTPLITAPVHMTSAERLLMFSLGYTLRPQSYLEIGTLHGGSALIMKAAMDASNNTAGRIVCVDPEPRISDDNWQVLKTRTTLIKGFSPDALRDARAAAGSPFNLVLIDGDHSAEGVVRDAAGVLPYVAPEAVLMFHDCFNPVVARGIGTFLSKHGSVLEDFGPMTRETSNLPPPNDSATWGGIYMTKVRA